MKQNFDGISYNYTQTLDDVEYFDKTEQNTQTPEKQAEEERLECHEMFRFVKVYKGIIYKTIKFNLAEMFEQENFINANERLGIPDNQGVKKSYAEKMILDKELHQQHEQEYNRGLMMIDIFSKCQNILINKPVKKNSNLVDNVIKFDLQETEASNNNLFKISDNLFESHIKYNQALNNYYAEQNQVY